MINHLGTFMATYPTNKQLLISMMRTESNPTRIRLIAKYIHQK
jgi:ribosomal protein S17E